MAHTDNRLPIGTSAYAARDQKYARRLRETYVPARLKRWVKEEGVLMLKFDTAKDTADLLALLSGLIRIRLLIMRGIGWPKEPTMKGGKMPNALDSVRNHNPLGDLDVSTEVVPIPEPPTDG